MGQYAAPCGIILLVSAWNNTWSEVCTGSGHTGMAAGTTVSQAAGCNARCHNKGPAAAGAPLSWLPPAPAPFPPPTACKLLLAIGWQMHAPDLAVKICWQCSHTHPGPEIMQGPLPELSKLLLLLQQQLRGAH